MKIFALTFAYNENFFLRRWVDYYGSQLGLHNLFVLDHGSHDLSLEGLGSVNIIKVPRTPFDDVKKVDFASYFHRALLSYFDAGFATDADEFIVADPAKYKNLSDFATKSSANALACIGLELYHIRSLETEFVDTLPILFQRNHVIFDSWISKRSFSRVPIQFGGGFHSSDQPVVFDEDLYLIHAKNFNFNHRLIRQAVTATWEYAGDFGTHARQPVEYVNRIFSGIEAKMATGKVSNEFNFKDEITQCLANTIINPSGEYDFNFNGGFQGSKLHLVPKRFRNLF